jgi:polysaccharide pyruvyl transferase WcaK-like protein
MSERPRRVFLVGLYGVENVGDDAIRLAVERSAPALGATVHRYAVRRAARDARAVRLRGGWRAYLAAIHEADTVALGGGGLLKDEGHALLRGYGILLELLATALVARALRRRVALLAIGAGPIHTRRGRWLVRAVATLAHVRQVRDEDSAQTLRALGVRSVEVTTDPTFTLYDAPAASGGADAPATGAPPAQAGELGAHAVVSMRPWFMFEPDRDTREAALHGAFAAAADVLARTGSAPRFASLYWPRDREASDATIARMEAADAAQALDGPLDWDALAEQLRGARLLVAMRYHAIACAAMAGCAIVPVAYEPKVSALAQALGVPFLDVEDARLAERLPALTAEALADPVAHRASPERLAALAQDARAGLRRALVA